ncbi:MAG: hypothetical protein JWR50_4013 [Mucilaginibacter sp.]|nr:hypothetical protein [Mucilaginibacter sp.]
MAVAHLYMTQKSDPACKQLSHLKHYKTKSKMYIAHSATQDITPQLPTDKNTDEQQHNIRLKAYMATCNKFYKEITAVQKYIPGWVPAYPVL